MNESMYCIYFSFTSYKEMTNTASGSSWSFSGMCESKLFSSVRLFETPWTRVHGTVQARILKLVEKFPSPGDLPNPGIKPRCPGRLLTSWATYDLLQTSNSKSEVHGKGKCRIILAQITGRVILLSWVGGAVSEESPWKQHDNWNLGEK